MPLPAARAPPLCAVCLWPGCDPGWSWLSCPLPWIAARYTFPLCEGPRVMVSHAQPLRLAPQAPSGSRAMSLAGVGSLSVFCFCASLKFMEVVLLYFFH